VTVLLGFKAIGKNLDSNLKLKASFKVLTNNIIPDYLTILLKEEKLKAASIYIALNLFDLYPDLPNSLKKAFIEKRESLGQDTKEDEDAEE
jgi:hypothetical protein